MPHLHDLTLTATVAGQRSDRRTTRFGIRQFDYEYKTPLPFVASAATRTPRPSDLGAQQARYVRIKCQARATGWGFSLWTLSVLDSATPGTDLALHQPTTASTQDDVEPRCRQRHRRRREHPLVLRLRTTTSGSRWTSGAACPSTRSTSPGSRRTRGRTSCRSRPTARRGRTRSRVDNTAMPLPFNGGDASLQTRGLRRDAPRRYVRISGGVREHQLGQLAVVAVRRGQRRRPAPTWPCTRRPPPRPRTPRTRRPTPPTATPAPAGPRTTRTTSGSRWTSARRRPSTGSASCGSRRTRRRT